MPRPQRAGKLSQLKPNFPQSIGLDHFVPCGPNLNDPHSIMDVELQNVASVVETDEERTYIAQNSLLVWYARGQGYQL